MVYFTNRSTDSTLISDGSSESTERIEGSQGTTFSQRGAAPVTSGATELAEMSLAFLDGTYRCGNTPGQMTAVIKDGRMVLRDSFNHVNIEHDLVWGKKFFSNEDVLQAKDSEGNFRRFLKDVIYREDPETPWGLQWQDPVSGTDYVWENILNPRKVEPLSLDIGQLDGYYKIEGHSGQDIIGRIAGKSFSINFADGHNSELVLTAGTFEGVTGVQAHKNNHGQYQLMDCYKTPEGFTFKVFDIRTFSKNGGKVYKWTPLSSDEPIVRKVMAAAKPQQHAAGLSKFTQRKSIPIVGKVGSFSSRASVPNAKPQLKPLTVSRVALKARQGALRWKKNEVDVEPKRVSSNSPPMLPKRTTRVVGTLMREVQGTVQVKLSTNSRFHRPAGDQRDRVFTWNTVA